MTITKTLKKTAAGLVGTLLMLTTLVAVSAPPADASFECPTGSFEDMHGKCRKPVADTVACPDGTLGVPGGCYIVVDHEVNKRGHKVCPDRAVETRKGECRVPIAHVTVCPDDALGVPGGCYIIVPKVPTKMIAA